MKLKKSLMKISFDTSTSQLSALLEQREKFIKKKFWPALKANTDKLRNYEVSTLFRSINLISKTFSGISKAPNC